VSTLNALMDEPKELIDRVKTYAGEKALEDLPAITLNVTLQAGFNPADPASLAGRSVKVEPVVHPLLAAQLDLSGARRRGEFVWTASNTDTADARPYQTLASATASGLVHPHDRVSNTRGPVDLSALVRNGKRTDSWSWWQKFRQRAHYRVWGFCSPLAHKAFDDRPPYRFGVISLEATARQGVYIRVHTHNLEVPDELGVEAELNLHPAGGSRIDAKPIRGADAVVLVDWAQQQQLPVLDTSGGLEVSTLMEAAGKTVSVWPMPGEPARAMAAIGRDAPNKVRTAFGQSGDTQSLVNVLPMSADPLREAMDATADAEAVIIHPKVRDVATMATAEPFEDVRLRPYQQEMVAKHLATRYGLVNAMEPGLGKTVTTLVAMMHRAAAKHAAGERYFGLIASEANTRAQWAGEVKTWTDYDNIRLVVIDNARKRTLLAEALADEEDDRPLFVVTSHSLVSRVEDAVEPKEGEEPDPLGELLLQIEWDDLIADEAVGLKSTGSKFTRSMWRLRDRAEVALALTGTPISKSLDELGRLIAWTRNDRQMFHGVRLSTRFSMNTDEGRHAFQDAVGTLVFRRDKSEVEGELPEVEHTVTFLEPRFEERALAAAAVKGLREQYDELVATTERAAELDPDNPMLPQIRERLQEARNAVNTSRELARKATSDPESLLKSESTAARLLRRYIERANEETGTKRAWAVNYTQERVAAGDQVLIFTVFAQTAKGLVKDLTDAGLTVGEVLGGGGKKRDRHIAEFSEGDRDVLVCTAAGERGLNLQMAGVVVHYDLPWTPDSIVQRTGRVERIGATAEKIRVVFPVMTDTIEERVAALVVSRAALMMQALDASRGVDLDKTNAGRALAGLAEHVDVAELDETSASLVEMTRLVLQGVTTD